MSSFSDPAIAIEYIKEEKILFAIPSDPNLIPAISSYISRLVEAKGDACTPSALELVLDEALTNAIYQGNLEICSATKAENFDKFYEIADLKRREFPFSARCVFVTFSYQGKTLSITVRDEGRGFDWRNFIDHQGSDSEKPFGRGLGIMRKFTSAMEFNSTGNEVTLYFSGCRLRPTM